MVVRTFSIRTGLAASTVTPGRTAPDESRTMPAIEACANAADGTATAHASTTSALVNPRIAVPFRCRVTPPNDGDEKTGTAVSGMNRTDFARRVIRPVG